MFEQKQQGVDEPSYANVPADQGLSSLGLLMQLGGNLFAVFGILIAFYVTFAARGSGQVLWVLLLLGSCIGRSFLHRSAGTQLLYGRPGFAEEGANQRLAGVRRYIIVALVQTLFAGSLLAVKFNAPSKVAFAIMVGLAVWPALLGVVLLLPRFRRFMNDLPLTEDKGFEGASILMTVLGLGGAIGMGTFLLLLLELPRKALVRGPGVLLLLALVMLLIRSILHVQAGLSGLRETSVDKSVERANRYANFGVISSFCAAGAFLIVAMQGGNLPGLVAVCALCWLLLSWPLIIRRFFSDRQFADLLAGPDVAVHHRAPDAGLTSLGWLLVAYAAYSASFLFPMVLATDGGSRDVQQVLALGAGSAGMRSIWFSVGLVLLQGWAGFELIRMSPHSRIVASVYGVVATIVTLYINWPMLEMMMNARVKVEQVLVFGTLSLSLIVPIATLALVNRKIAPTARARFRQKPADPPTS